MSAAGVAGSTIQANGRPKKAPGSPSDTSSVRRNCARMIITEAEIE